MTSTVTMDFREEFEAERTRWLHKRFLWFCAITMGVLVLGLVLGIPAILMAEDPDATPGRVVVLQLLSGVPQFAILLACFARVRRQALSRDRLVKLVFWLFVIVGTLDLLPVPLYGPWATAPTVGPFGIASPDAPVRNLFLMHLFAAMLIPWTPREAIRPLVPLLILIAAITLIFSELAFDERMLVVLVSPLIGVPGVAIAWWRHSRFRTQFHFMKLRGEYGTMKRELTDARRIHDVLFPEPIADGPVRFDFRYEPMRQIGGDYLYTCVDESSDGRPARLSVVIIDVTGHGISAALTVNRIHGELERLFGEHRDLSPGDTVTALNHYINVTLAKHNVYATALCLRIDSQRDVVEWASAGHPPAFVLTASGLIDRLESTAFMLGAASDEEFQANAESMPLKRGDTVIAYTDGVTEARNQKGRMLTIEGVQAVMASLAARGERSDCADALLRAVQEHRFGPVADDTLIVQINRPLGE